MGDAFITILVATLLGGHPLLGDDPIVTSIPYPDAKTCGDAIPYLSDALLVAYPQDEIMIQCIRTDLTMSAAPETSLRPVARPW